MSKKTQTYAIYGGIAAVAVWFLWRQVKARRAIADVQPEIIGDPPTNTVVALNPAVLQDGFHAVERDKLNRAGISLREDVVL